MDAIFDPVDPANLGLLDADPDIGVHSLPANDYGRITINCQKYPLNISGFRKAFAYAFDKTRVISEVKDGHATVHDSVIPLRNSWRVEDQLSWNYYTNQSDLGNQILNGLGFEINSGTGFRDMPNGTPFEVSILTPVASGVGPLFDGDEIALMTVEVLASLHIDASIESVEWFEIVDLKTTHPDYDMAFYEWSFNTNDVEPILLDYLSEYTEDPWLNPSKYANATYDSLVDDFHNGATYEEVSEAIFAIQRNIQENVPVLIVYEDTDYQAYRVEDYTGHIEDDYWGVSGPWTNLKVHNKSGNPFNGVFVVAIGQLPDTFNLFLADSEVESVILSNLYSSLYKTGPDTVAYPDLAERVLIETHSSNLIVPEGQAWVTIDIREDAVWSDGSPLDAEDVAFTFKYINETRAYGNPKSLVGWVDDFLSSEAVSSSRVRVVLSRNSYHHIQQIMLTDIIPEHIFNNETGIGYEGWNSWNPVFGSDPHVTCGPFVLSDHSSWTFELSRNLEYHWPSGTSPKVLSVGDITYVEGAVGNQIVWEVEDEDPFKYKIFQNGSLVETDDWNGSDIVYTVDGLSAGTYNFTLVLTDTSEYIVADTVWVTVTPREPGISQGPLVMGIAAASTVIIIAVGVVVLRRR